MTTTEKMINVKTAINLLFLAQRELHNLDLEACDDLAELICETKDEFVKKYWNELNFNQAEDIYNI
jgi:aminoglycoside phosphotransferase